MAQAARRTGLSEQDYLAFERAEGERHEYADGEIFAMSGGTWEHSLIAGNLLGELRAALRERQCTAHGSDMRIHIPSTGRYRLLHDSWCCAARTGRDLRARRRGGGRGAVVRC